MSLCSGIRADGGRCRAQAMRNSEWCIGHHPDRAEARQRRASKGGKRGGRGRPLADLGVVKKQLRELAEDVVAGHTDRGDAAVVSQVLNVYLRAVSVEIKVKEQDEILQRIDALESTSGQADRRGGTWG